MRFMRIMNRNSFYSRASCPAFLHDNQNHTQRNFCCFDHKGTACSCVPFRSNAKRGCRDPGGSGLSVRTTLYNRKLCQFSVVIQSRKTFMVFRLKSGCAQALNAFARPVASRPDPPGSAADFSIVFRRKDTHFTCLSLANNRIHAAREF